LYETPSGEKEYSTTKIAELVGVANRTIYRWINDERITFRRTETGRYRFPESELNRILKERKKRNLGKIKEVIIKTVGNKKVAYLRELQITLEDYYFHEDVTDVCDYLVVSGLLNTTDQLKWGNRWYFPKEVSWGAVESLAAHKKQLMNLYISHPRRYSRRGIIYDDYSEMFVEDALLKSGYIVVSKNAHYYNGKEYHQSGKRPGRKSDLDYIAYERSKNCAIGIQIKNRLEYPKMDDLHLLLDICRTLDLTPVLVTRLSHPRIHSVMKSNKGHIIQVKRYLLQPPFGNKAFKEITNNLRIPLGVYKWVPEFMIRRFNELREKL